MKRTITTTIMLVFLISFASAIYSGECDTIEFPNEDNVSLEITGNTNSMEGFNWSKNGTTITYCLDLGFKEDNFTIRFYNSQGEADLQGGGGSRWSYSKPKEVVENETTNETEEVIKDLDEKSDLEVWTGALEEKSPIPTTIAVILFAILIIVLMKSAFKHSKNKQEVVVEKD